MNTRTLTLRFAALALIATAGSVVFFAGCGGDDNAVVTPTHLPDAGTDSKPTKEDASTPDGSKPEKDGGKDGSNDANKVSDVSLETSSSCKSDSSSCNSCYDDAQAASDPYNACSAYTTNCQPFAGTVPAHPTL